MKKIILGLSAILLNSLFSMNSALGFVSVGAGIEQFQWREYASSGFLEESGFRYTLRLDLEQDRSQGFLLGYAGKLYQGTVNYNGFTWGSAPVTTDTAYSGIQNEGFLIFRQPFGTEVYLDWVDGLGWDHWSRSIKNTALNTNQVEDYDILYLKIGPLLSLRGKSGPWVSAGGKLPVGTWENAHLDSIGFDQNPTLNPGKRLSFFWSAGYRFNREWETTLYYDSYRFSESEKEKVTIAGVSPGSVYQPESHMEIFGIQAIYHFP